MTDRIVVVTMCGGEEEALRLARAMVERRLAACAQILPGVTSVYHWKGTVETSAEWQVAFKTRGELYGRLEAAIRELHSYEVPEILALPVEAGLPAYLEWMDAELAG